MPWIDTTQYNQSDICPICHEEYGTTKAIYKTVCNHNFHNDCLHDYCESTNSEILCPICRSNLGYACTDVWAFKEKALENSRGGPLFNGNEHILKIYNAQQGGRRRKRIKKTTIKKNKIKRKTRKTRKSRKTNRRRRI